MRDAGDLLEKVGIPDAYQFIEDNPHPRLWYGYQGVALFALPCAQFHITRSRKLSLWGIYRTPAMKFREFLPAESYKYLSFYFPMFSDKVRQVPNISKDFLVFFFYYLFFLSL